MSAAEEAGLLHPAPPGSFPRLLQSVLSPDPNGSVKGRESLPRSRERGARTCLDSLGVSRS